MRILCNNLGQFEPGAWRVEAEHEVVRLDYDHIVDAWAFRGPGWQEELLPEGWTPDVALFYSPEYQLLPPAIWDLPCPVALWVGDWYMDPNGMRQLAPYVDLMLSDAGGAAALRRAGIANVAECSPWAFDPATHQRDWDAEPLFDLSFVGSLNDVIHLDRNRWLRRVLELPEPYRVHVATGVFGEAYGEILRRSRIGFNHSVAGGVNMRCFEIAASGSLLFVERSNHEAGKWFRDREECVLYGPDDFEDLVAYYLENEDERRAVAEAGWKRVRDYAPDARVPRLVERLEALASAPPTRATPTRVDGARIGAFQTLHMPAGERPYTDLEVVLEEAEQDNPEDAALLVNRGMLYALYARRVDTAQREDVLDAALEYLDRAAAADPTDAIARFNRAAVLADLDLPAEAATGLRALLADLEAGRAVARTDRVVHRAGIDDFVMASLHASFADVGDAEAALTRLLTGEVAERLAGVTDDPEERRALLELAVELKASVDARRRLAAEHVAGARFEEALAQTELAIAEKPLLQPLWDEHVAVLLALGRADEARAVAADIRRLARRIPHWHQLADALELRVGTPALARPVVLDAA